MTLHPSSVDELQQIVRDRRAVQVRGGRTKSAPADAVVSLTGLSGVTDYSAEECVFTARGGTSLQEITAMLAAHGQYLPFDPPLIDEGATIGGTIASGVSGPRRYRYGGIRDFLIGVRIVDGEGRSIRSGGKVVKNAAGFLLHHGMVGSCGRFGVITEATFKVFPAPEARRTFQVACGNVEDAFVTALRIESLRFDCEAIDFDEGGTLRVTIAGRESAIDARLENLTRAAGVSLGHDAGPDPASFMAAHSAVSDPASCAQFGVVKVAGLMKSWQNVRPYVRAAQFMCAGTVAWLATDNLPGLGRALDEAGLAGQVIRGSEAGTRIGHVVHNAFEEHVRRVLDPQNRFSAAPHSEQ